LIPRHGSAKYPCRLIGKPLFERPIFEKVLSFPDVRADGPPGKAPKGKVNSGGFSRRYPQKRRIVREPPK
jgi:hypothetical protein